VPDWTAAGPGAIDIGRLAGNGASPGTIPRPRARTGQERAREAGMADFDDMFEAPVAGSLSRVG
jgi:hypothetical protein